jgi:hypothetical protein
MTLTKKDIVKTPELITLLSFCQKYEGRQKSDTFIHPDNYVIKAKLPALIGKVLEEKNDYIICKSGDVILKGISIDALLKIIDDAKEELLSKYNKLLKEFVPKAKALKDEHTNYRIKLHSDVFSMYCYWEETPTIIHDFKEFWEFNKKVEDMKTKYPNLLEVSKHGSDTRLVTFDNNILLPKNLEELESANQKLDSLASELEIAQNNYPLVVEALGELVYTDLDVGQDEFSLFLENGEYKLSKISQAKSDAFRWSNIKQKKSA